jgi:hypothetical protein
MIKRYSDTVWTADFETPVYKLYFLFISADAAQEKKEKKVLLPTGASKSTVDTVHLNDIELDCI